MFNREFEYVDYKGNKKKATYWFSLEKDEMLKMELGNYGGLEEAMRRMYKEERPDKILDLLEDIVLSAVGEISPDGESFYKNDTIRERFRNTKVYHDLLFELLGDADAMQKFILSCIPAEVAAKFAAVEDGDKAASGEVVKLPVPGETGKDNAGH